jgi:hypothetical protein
LGRCLDCIGLWLRYLADSRPLFALVTVQLSDPDRNRVDQVAKLRQAGDQWHDQTHFGKKGRLDLTKALLRGVALCGSSGGHTCMMLKKNYLSSFLSSVDMSPWDLVESERVPELGSGDVEVMFAIVGTVKRWREPQDSG